MIRIEELEFAYGEGDFRLHIGRLEISPAQKVAFIGPSGSGKTTLLQIISGILQPVAGRVSVADSEMTRMSDAARRDFRVANIGFVFQEFELLEYLDVMDNILLPYRISDAMMLTQDVRKRAAEVAGEVGIGDKLRRFPHQLSQGERQRVVICRAVLPLPKVILADEPTGNLDPANKKRVLETLIQSAAGVDATLITVTHDHSLLSCFDRVVDFEDFHSSTKTAPASPSQTL